VQLAQQYQLHKHIIAKSKHVDDGLPAGNNLYITSVCITQAAIDPANNALIVLRLAI
jgi:hypothetical protein